MVLGHICSRFLTIVAMQTLDYVLFMFLYPIDNALKVNAGLDDTDDDDDDDERGLPRGNS